MNKETWTFIQENTTSDVHTLALQAAKHLGVDMHFALQQIAGRQKAKYKLPTFYNHPLTQYPISLSMEQCSSELTACYKARVISGNSLIDMTGGFGIDSFFLSETNREVWCIERNNNLRDISEYNFKLFAKTNVHSICADGIKFLEESEAVDNIFIDPARRNEKGKKVVLLSDCEPDVTQLLPLFKQKAKRVLIKLSPMLDITLAKEQLPQTQEIHILSVDNECKEILFLLDYEKNTVDFPTLIATNLYKEQIQTFTFSKFEEQNANITYTSELKKYLYEPNASVLKAGAFKSVAKKFGLEKLHPNTHLYTSNDLHTNFCGRFFEVERSFGLQKQDLKLIQHTISKANIATRNFVETPEILRKKLKIADGGDVYLFATTLHNNKRIIIQTHKV